MFYGNPRSRRRVHHVISSRGLFVLVAISTLLYLNIIRISSPYLAHPNVIASATQTKVVNDTPIIETKTYAPNTDSSSINEQELIRQVNATSTTPSTTCTGSSYALPAAANLSLLSAGLHAVTDTPSYYSVSAFSLNGLRDAIENCTYRKAAGKYHAITAYQLNWQYSSTTTNGTTCSLTNVKVGMHINQFMPQLSADAQLPTEASTAWSNYSASLRTHEQGHVNLDKQYAQKLLIALQGMNNESCASIGEQAKTTINSYVTILNTANDLYDSKTNHGATQGAVL